MTRLARVKPHGFTLIEIVVVLAVMSVVLAMAAMLLRSLTVSTQSKLTTAALQNADLGLMNFVIQAKRLPCPADGSLSAADPAYGVERPGAGPGTCANNQARGVLPWVTLGLSSTAATDGYGNLLTYRVDPQLTVASALDLTQCDAAGGVTINAAKPNLCMTCDATLAPPGVPAGCTSPSAAITARGLRIQDAVTLPPGRLPIQDPLAVPPLGAAYVLISHGANMGRGYTAQGGLNPGVQPLSDGEAQNGADNALQAMYIDMPIAATFDDVLLHPTILTVVNHAGLGPRAHPIPP